MVRFCLLVCIIPIWDKNATCLWGLFSHTHFLRLIEVLYSTWDRVSVFPSIFFLKKHVAIREVVSSSSVSSVGALCHPCAGSASFHPMLEQTSTIATLQWSLGLPAPPSGVGASCPSVGEWGLASRDISPPVVAGLPSQAITCLLELSTPLLYLDSQDAGEHFCFLFSVDTFPFCFLWCCFLVPSASISAVPPFLLTTMFALLWAISIVPFPPLLHLLLKPLPPALH